MRVDADVQWAALTLHPCTCLPAGLPASLPGRTTRRIVHTTRYIQSPASAAVTCICIQPSNHPSIRPSQSLCGHPPAHRLGGCSARPDNNASSSDYRQCRSASGGLWSGLRIRSQRGQAVACPFLGLDPVDGVSGPEPHRPWRKPAARPAAATGGVRQTCVHSPTKVAHTRSWACVAGSGTAASHALPAPMPPRCVRLLDWTEPAWTRGEAGMPLAWLSLDGAASVRFSHRSPLPIRAHHHRHHRYACTSLVAHASAS